MLTDHHNILLIDDDSDVLDAYTQLLTGPGIGFTPAAIREAYRIWSARRGPALCSAMCVCRTVPVSIY